MTNVFETPAPVQIMNVFDTNGDGDVDFAEFRDIVGKLLLPGAMMLPSAQAAFAPALRVCAILTLFAPPWLRGLGCTGNRHTPKLWSPHVDSDACA